MFYSSFQHTMNLHCKSDRYFRYFRIGKEVLILRIIKKVILADKLGWASQVLDILSFFDYRQNLYFFSQMKASQTLYILRFFSFLCEDEFFVALYFLECYILETETSVGKLSLRMCSGKQHVKKFWIPPHWSILSSCTIWYCALFSIFMFGFFRIDKFFSKF